MVGFSWFLTRSSIQVQAWPVHRASFTKQIADRHSRPLHSRLRLPPVISHPAKGRQTSCSPFPAFPLALARFSRPQKVDPACPGPVSLPAESPLAFLFLLASQPQHASKPKIVKQTDVMPGRGTTDAIFIVRQLQEKYMEKRKLSIQHHCTNK